MSETYLKATNEKEVSDLLKDMAYTFGEKTKVIKDPVITILEQKVVEHMVKMMLGLWPIGMADLKGITK